ncbi:beta-1,3-galactosyltransferase 5-like [Babylonia areolata]|uniref:beta-1,3-galactosyltransferase 5-like n=1 Tax=Babylonia areolata TaxID=304850 RepID=UPI003FD1FAEF
MLCKWVRRIWRRRSWLVCVLIVTTLALVYYGNVLHAADLITSVTDAGVNTTSFPAGFNLQNNRAQSKEETAAPVAVHPQNSQRLVRQDESQRIPKNLHKADDWPQFFLPRSQQQFSLEYPYLYRASRACQTPVDMLVMTLSRPQNSRERQVIRETWGSVVTTRTWPGPTPQTLPKSVALIFLMGEDRKLGPNVSDAVRLESEKYGDIVQWEGLQDAYFNLTLKVLLGLKWMAEFCPNVSHVIKTDDDTFVHVPRLQRLLSTASADLIWGPYFTTSPCDRVGKYAVSREAYPFNIYPPHVKGNLYVLPGKSVARMVAVAPYLPYNNMEDVHVTGTLARTLALRHRAFKLSEFSPVPKVPDSCIFQNKGDFLGSQMVSPELAHHFWKTFSGSQPCRPVRP